MCDTGDSASSDRVLCTLFFLFLSHKCDESITLCSGECAVAEQTKPTEAQPQLFSWQTAQLPHNTGGRHLPGLSSPGSSLLSLGFPFFQAKFKAFQGRFQGILAVLSGAISQTCLLRSPARHSAHKPHMFADKSSPSDCAEYKQAHWSEI